MNYISDKILEATEEFIQETAVELFEVFPLLESFSWTQGYIDSAPFCAEEFVINEGSYHGADSRWQQNVSNQLRWAFDVLEPINLLSAYGSNMCITITRNETNISPIEQDKTN